MATQPQSQQNSEKTFLKQDKLRFAPKAIQFTAACLFGKRDDRFRTKMTIKQMEIWTGYSERSVQTATRWLEDQGFYHIQEWRVALHYNDPNIYILEDEFRSPEWLSFFTSFFKKLCAFATFSLLSMTASGEDCTALHISRSYLYGIDLEMIRRCREPDSFKSFFKDRHHHPSEIEVPFASHQARQADIGLSKTAPSGGTPLRGLENKIHKRERVSTMNNPNQLPFTEEQLLQLVDFSKEAIEHANKALTRELMGGKSIANQFGYFLSCCRNFKSNPSFKKSSPHETVSKEKVESLKAQQNERYQQFMDKRAQKRFDRLIELGYDPNTMHPWEQTEVLNRDRMSYYTGEDCTNTQPARTTTVEAPVTYKETDLEFAINYEKAIHKRTQEQPEFAKTCARYDRNPLWTKFTPEQQQAIWLQAHGPSCTCRKNEQAGLIMPDIAAKLAQKIPVTQVTPLEEEYLDASLFEEVL